MKEPEGEFGFARMVRSAPSFEQAWKAGQAANSEKAKSSNVLVADLGKPQIELLMQNYWPDCECTYCLTWQKIVQASKQDFANRKTQYIRETE